MTRLPDGVSRPGQRRVVSSSHGDLVVVLTDRTITVKPKGARTNGVVNVSWGAVYQRAIMDEINAVKRAKRNARRKK